MRSYLIPSLALLVMLPLSAQAQLNKHDKSIAHHGYSIPIITDGAQVLSPPGQTLRDDVDQGILPQAPVTPPVMPAVQNETPNFVPSLPPAMPQAKDLKSDIDQITEKKTLKTEAQVPTKDFLTELAKKALSEGDKAKDFSLTDVSGKTVNLYQELANGPVVVIWYRGGWCPYCNLQLKTFQDKLDIIKKAGAQLIAISPELPDNSMTTAQKNNLAYYVLSDTNNNVAREYGLVYTAPDDLKQKLPDLDLKKHNGTETREIPLAATYVIDSDGTIAYALISPDYKIRAQPDDVITVLGDIAAKESIRKSRIRQAMAREAERLDKKNKQEALQVQPNIVPDSVPIKEALGAKTSKVEKLEETVTIKQAFGKPITKAKDVAKDEVKEEAVKLKPMVDVVSDPATTLEVRAKEEGLIPETY